MRIKTYKSINYFLGILGCFSLIFILIGEWKTATAVWIMTACLLPSLWLALGTTYLSLKIYCFIVISTQIITLPSFYFQQDRYFQSAVSYYRPFEFGAFDVFETYIILGLFLWLLVFLVKQFERLSNSPIKRGGHYNSYSDLDPSEGYSSIYKPKYSVYSSISILFLIAISMPFKLWMFNMGIGLVGTTPPELPFRLSGILFYLFNYLTPLAIGYFYIKTKRNSLLMALTISVYAIIIGALSVSKGVVLLPIVPIIAFAWLDRRYTILSTSLVLAGLGVLMIASARSFVHIAGGGAAFTELGVFGTVTASLFELSWSMNMLLVFVDIANRFAGFQDMFLASQFNADAVGGAWNIFINIVTFSQYDLIEHDAIHQEYLGYTIPYGYYGVGATFNTWMMMAVNSNILMILPFVIYAAFILVILEKTLKGLSRKYSSPLSIELASIFFLVVIFFTMPATIILLFALALCLVFYLFPIIVLKRK